MTTEITVSQQEHYAMCSEYPRILWSNNTIKVNVLSEFKKSVNVLAIEAVFIYCNGVLHSLTEPAYVDKKMQHTRWYKNGLYHRAGDVPALISPTEQHWFKNGVRHRLNKPAIILTTGHRKYVQHGVLHNTRGPAIIYPGRKVRYFINDEELSHDRFLFLKDLVPHNLKNWTKEHATLFKLSI